MRTNGVSGNRFEVVVTPPVLTLPEAFQCAFPGCSRSFNVESNMRRHYRNHEHNGSPSKPAAATPHQFSPMRASNAPTGWLGEDTLHHGMLRHHSEMDSAIWDSNDDPFDP